MPLPWHENLSCALFPSFLLSSSTDANTIPLFSMICLYTILGLCLVFQCQALTYYIDSTCRSPDKIMSTIITEVKSMASEGSTRLKSPDLIMSSAFDIIFKGDKSNSAAYTKATSKSRPSVLLSTLLTQLKRYLMQLRA